MHIIFFYGDPSCESLTPTLDGKTRWIRNVSEYKCLLSSFNCLGWMDTLLSFFTKHAAHFFPLSFVFQKNNFFVSNLLHSCPSKKFFSPLSLSCKKKFFFFDKWKLLRHFFIFFFCVGEKIIVFVENDLCSSASKSDSRIQQGKPGNKSSERIWRLIS